MIDLAEKPGNAAAIGPEASPPPCHLTTPPPSTYHSPLTTVVPPFGPADRLRHLRLAALGSGGNHVSLRNGGSDLADLSVAPALDLLARTAAGVLDRTRSSTGRIYCR